MFKMVSQGPGFVMFSLVFCMISASFALECWKCSSDYDSTCRDYFNTTRILQNQRHLNNYNYGNVQPARTEPHLITCEGMHTSTIGQYKNVCLKRVVTVPNGLKQVVRECRMVNRNLKKGECPEDVYDSHSRSLEYCGTCEYDGCNLASKNNVFVAGLIPAVILLIRK